MSQTGNWYHAGDDFTYEWTKFHFPYSDPKDPRFNYGRWTWHFNQTPEELKGQKPSNPTLDNPVHFKTPDGGSVAIDLWPADSGYPDSIVTGVPHVNYYDGYAEFSDFKLYVNAAYEYELDVYAEDGGRIEGTPSGNYNAVTPIALSAVPDDGYEFAGWEFIDVSKGLVLNPESPDLNFTMPIGNMKMVAMFEKLPIAITSIKINAVAIENIKRNETRTFTVTLNEGASDERIVWTTANPALAEVTRDGTVTVKNVIGTVVLTATDPVSRRSHSVLLRIAS
jgi:hypothetical protein